MSVTLSYVTIASPVSVTVSVTHPGLLFVSSSVSASTQQTVVR